MFGWQAGERFGEEDVAGVGAELANDHDAVGVEGEADGFAFGSVGRGGLGESYGMGAKDKCRSLNNGLRNSVVSKRILHGSWLVASSLD